MRVKKKAIAQITQNRLKKTSPKKKQKGYYQFCAGVFEQDENEVDFGYSGNVFISQQDDELIITPMMSPGGSKIRIPFSSISKLACREIADVAQRGSVIGQSIIGGVLAGGAGAIVGAVNASQGKVEYNAYLVIETTEGEVVYLRGLRQEFRKFSRRFHTPPSVEEQRDDTIIAYIQVFGLAIMFLIILVGCGSCIYKMTIGRN